MASNVWGGGMPTILDEPPGFVADQVIDLVSALDRAPGEGGEPVKNADSLLIATWNLREFGRFTPKWRSTRGDSPARDLRSLLCIAHILKRFDVIAIQELQGYTDALRAVLSWLNRDWPARWRIVVSDVFVAPPATTSASATCSTRPVSTWTGLSVRWCYPPRRSASRRPA